jgi:hypothetical protein
MSDRTKGTQGTTCQHDTPDHRLHLDVGRLDVFIRSDGPDGPTAIRPWMVTLTEPGSRRILGVEISSDEAGSEAAQRLLRRTALR